MYPYLGLRRFGASDRLLYHGRERDLKLCRDQLLNPAVRVLVLHGLSGSGKSSFLRAGLMPGLEAEGRSLGTGGGIVPISEVVTAGADMLRDLAHQVYRFVIEGEGQAPWRDQRAGLLNRFGARDAFIQEVAERPGALMEFIGQLSHDPRYVALIAIDQVEEYFTGSGAADDEARDAFLEIVDRFARERLNGKLVLSLRTEQYGVFASRLPQSVQPAYAGDRGIQRVFHHYLVNPKREQLLSLVTAPDAGYGFEFEAGAAEHIVDHLMKAAAASEMSVLPLLQTVLLRLYMDARSAAVSQGKPVVITRSSFDTLSDLADGKGPALVSEFVDWGLSRAVEQVTALAPGSQQHRMEVSCWHEVLRSMASRSPLGVLVREKKARADLKVLARSAECGADPDRMAAALSAPGIGLFSVGGDGSVALQHDVICLSLDLRSEIPAPGFWLQSARNRRRRILKAATYGIEDLFDDDKPVPQALRVAELRFWDHKSLAYATHLGLFARLGLEAEIVRVEEDISASSLCRMLQQKSGAHAVFSYPRVLMDRTELEECRDVVVLNSFAGYAIVCNRAAATTLHPFEEQESWESFEAVCTQMLQLQAAGCRFEAEDDGARVFLSHMVEIYRQRTSSAADLSVELPSELVGIEFVNHLLHHEKPFIAVVTTPTWALADERNMLTVIGQRALLGLLDNDSADPGPQLTTLRRKLEIRNVMNLKLGVLPRGEDRDALMLRLLSVGLFVAEYIWAQDKEAGRWIRDRWMRLDRTGDHRISLPMFTRTFRRSCAYVTAQEHGRRYHGTAWNDDCTRALSLHQRWQEEQMSYERQLTAMTALQETKADAAAPQVCALVTRARRHAGIENYYDANRLMSLALRSVTNGGGVPVPLPGGESR